MIGFTLKKKSGCNLRPKKKTDCVKEARRRAANVSRHPGEQPQTPGLGGGCAVTGREQ